MRYVEWRARPTMETAVTFEYLIVESKLFDKKVQIIEQEMNELGNEGWEMVAACGVHGQTFVFKRMVPEAAPKRRLKATASVPASDLLEIRLENTCIASCSFRPTSASCVHGCQQRILGRWSETRLQIPLRCAAEVPPP
jgi:hypothetical protein